MFFAHCSVFLLYILDNVILLCYYFIMHFGIRGGGQEETAAMMDCFSHWFTQLSLDGKAWFCAAALLFPFFCYGTIRCLWRIIKRRLRRVKYTCHGGKGCRWSGQNPNNTRLGLCSCPVCGSTAVTHTIAMRL